ncbi:SIMPL domain-containing protein [Roseobacteraceae bacterium NS-SX3]
MTAKRILASVFLLAATTGAVQAQDEMPPRQITVTGESRTEVAPSLATITLGVTEEAPEAAAAMAAVSESMAAVAAELRAAGVADKDMQTQRVSLHPVWSPDGPRENGRRKITGFAASNMLMVRVRDLDKLGGVLDQVLTAGANQFHGLSFGVEDPEEVKDRIRAAAVEDAIRKARQLAEAAGMVLGPVRSISEHGGGGGPRPMMAMEMARSDAMPIEAGELTFTHSVSVVFDMEAPADAPKAD